jgi:coiled-coil domain-containing protein 55
MSFSMNFSKGKKKSPTTKQYGLILPKKKQASQISMGYTNVFGSKEEEDEQEQSNHVQVSLLASKSINTTVIEKQYQKALEEDPNVFDYDGLYDEMQSNKKAAIANSNKAKQESKKESKYIQNLIQKAQIREIENERIRERKLLKERQAEDQLYGDKEKFISASYKRKLQEMKKWEEEDARLDAIEAVEDVTKKGQEAMAGFYANLLTKNIAMGSDVNFSKSAYTTGKTNKSKEISGLDDQKKRQRIESPLSSSAAPPLPLQPSKSSAKVMEAHEPTALVVAEDEPTQAQGVAKDLPIKVETTKVIEKSKEDTISDARARFLARKAAAASRAQPSI